MIRSPYYRRRRGRHNKSRRTERKWGRCRRARDGPTREMDGYGISPVACAAVGDEGASRRPGPRRNSARLRRRRNDFLHHHVTRYCAGSNGVGRKAVYRDSDSLARQSGYWRDRKCRSYSERLCATVRAACYCKRVGCTSNATRTSSYHERTVSRATKHLALRVSNYVGWRATNCRAERPVR